MNYTREVRPSRRAWHRLSIALVGGLMAAATVLPTGVFAVPPQPPTVQLGDDPPPPQTVPSCHSLAWSVPTVKIHVAESSGNRAAMEDAVRDVNAQIALVGGSMVRIASTVVTTDPFHYAPYNDNSPVIHVGFQSILEPNTLANTWNLWPCEHDITVDTGRMWNYGTPDDAGIERYYEAGLAGPVGTGTYYFRSAYQHELLHAFGVAASNTDGHPDNVYSFLNYRSLPWTNASADAMIRPLLYDVQQLWSMYPAPTARTEVAVLNSWFIREDSSVVCAPNLNKVDLDPGLEAFCDRDPRPEVVTHQERLCAPSAGDVSAANKAFLSYCGDAGDTQVCPGDVVQVHYALANYSTSSVTVTSNVWFSSDDVWDTGDSISPTSKVYTVPAATAHNKYWGYEFPDLKLFTARTFYVIVRVTATTASGVTVHDSIPMLGTVSAGSQCMEPQANTAPPTGVLVPHP